MKAVLVYSGGMDSTCLLYDYKEQISLLLHFQYGSKHNNKELECARYNAEKCGIPLLIVNAEEIFKNLESNLLLSGGEIPDGHYEDESMKKTVVPFRNGIMLSIAAGIAESKGCDTLLIANHAGDHAIYPDCREMFIKAMTIAISQGTWNGVKLLAPYTDLTKKEVAEIGKIKGVDFDKTWSCYKGGDVQCGVCGTCTERIEALL